MSLTRRRFFGLLVGATGFLPVALGKVRSDTTPVVPANSGLASVHKQQLEEAMELNRVATWTISVPDDLRLAGWKEIK